MHEDHKGRQGLASMTAERRREIASLGGKTVHAQGKAHRWTSDEASKAGRIGGKKSRRRKAARERGLSDETRA